MWQYRDRKSHLSTSIYENNNVLEKKHMPGPEIIFLKNHFKLESDKYNCFFCINESCWHCLWYYYFFLTSDYTEFLNLCLMLRGRTQESDIDDKYDPNKDVKFPRW